MNMIHLTICEYNIYVSYLSESSTAYLCIYIIYYMYINIYCIYIYMHTLYHPGPVFMDKSSTKCDGFAQVIGNR